MPKRKVDKRHRRIGLRGNLAVGGTSTRNRIPPRTDATMNLLARENDVERLEAIPHEVTLHVTKRGDVRMASWIDPSRIKQKPE